VGALLKEERDGFHEARLGGVVERGRAAAVGSLPGEAPVGDARAVTEEGGDVVGVILSSLVSGARKTDPRSRAVHARSGAREHGRELGVQHPGRWSIERSFREVRVGDYIEYSCIVFARDAR